MAEPPFRVMSGHFPARASADRACRGMGACIGGTQVAMAAPGAAADPVPPTD